MYICIYIYIYIYIYLYLKRETNNWILQFLKNKTKEFLVLQKMLFTLHVKVSTVQ